MTTVVIAGCGTVSLQEDVQEYAVEIRAPQSHPATGQTSQQITVTSIDGHRTGLGISLGTPSPGSDAYVKRASVKTGPNGNVVTLHVMAGSPHSKFEARKGDFHLEAKRLNAGDVDCTQVGCIHSQAYTVSCTDFAHLDYAQYRLSGNSRRLISGQWSPLDLDQYAKTLLTYPRSIQQTMSMTATARNVAWLDFNHAVIETCEALA